MCIDFDLLYSTYMSIHVYVSCTRSSFMTSLRAHPNWNFASYRRAARNAVSYDAPVVNDVINACWQINAVRDVIADRSKNDIHLALQFYEHDVTKTIQAFLDGRGSAVATAAN